MKMNGMMIFAIFMMMINMSCGRKPNIVMVLVDDWGYSDISDTLRNSTSGFKSGAKTPVMEQLVNEGRMLDRHYTYSWCAPSRMSFQSGRLPVHIVRDSFGDRTGNINFLAVNSSDPHGFNAIPLNMTGIAKKMKSAGYRTHMSGKWGAGFATAEHSPMGQGYDTFFGYLQSGNNYWNEQLTPNTIERPGGCELAFDDFLLTDLNRNNVPATDLNNTVWEDYLIMNHTMKTIAAHDPEDPLFLVQSFHSLHTPLDPPEELRHLADEENPSRRHYLGMLSFVDSSLGKIVDALKEKGMWENTLLVVTSDNGGPIYPSDKFGSTYFQMFGGASNVPFRGGKLSDFEGGIRTRAFVSGGLIPEAVRGTPLSDSYIHIADWYSTFCSLAGVDSFDESAHAAGLHPVDGIDQWPWISGSACEHTEQRDTIHVSASTLISSEWKLIHAAPEHMATKFDKYGLGWGLQAYAHRGGRDCSEGCLWNIWEDPTEANEVSAQYPKVTKAMKKMLANLNKDNFKNNINTTQLDACLYLRDHNQGFYGPFWDLESNSIYQN